MVQIDPADLRGQTYIQVATIQQWVQGTPKYDDEIKQAVAALEQLQKKEPSSPEIMFYLGARRHSRPPSWYCAAQVDPANQLLAECRTIVDDAYIANPKNPALNFVPSKSM